MPRGKKRTFTVFLLALLAGTGLHFLYPLLPVLPVALIAPVDESLFQHLKLLYLPLVLSALWLRRRGGRSAKPYLLGLLLSSALLLGAGWVYHITLGQSAMWFDLVLYVLLVALEFSLPRLCPEHPAGPLWNAVVPAAVLLGVLLIVFTFAPPGHLLFTDLSARGSFFSPTC